MPDETWERICKLADAMEADHALGAKAALKIALSMLLTCHERGLWTLERMFLEADNGGR